MKTRVIIIFLALFFSYNIQAQNQDTVTFTFSAEHICTMADLDSIRIDNVTQGRDTILHYPDTVLKILLPQIDNIHGFTYNRLSISQNYPNPFSEKTSFNVLVPENEVVTFRTHDVAGRLINLVQYDLQAGVHNFDFYPGSHEFYILSASTEKYSDEIRMVSLDRSYNSNTRISYKGSSMILLSKYFLYDIGDELMFYGYATLDNGQGRDTIVEVPLTDSHFTFTYENFVPDIPSDISGVFDICENSENVVYQVDSVDGIGYNWTFPEDWEIVSGQGASQITVNVGSESGLISVIPFNACGDGLPSVQPVYVQADITPEFSQIGPYCMGEVVDALPEFSVNGIQGTWDQDLSTDIPGTFTYVFTASNSCESQTSIDITIDQDITPTFDQLGPYCKGGVPDALPTTSTNGITGTWNAPIVTHILGDSIYTFTADNGCMSQNTMTVSVLDHPEIELPEFGPYCVGAIADDLPSQSLNGVEGAWLPPTIDTDNAGTVSHIFTANHVCQTEKQVFINIDSHVDAEFDNLGPYCLFSLPASLPEYSNNGIWGTWSPNISEVTASGIQDFTFTAGNLCQSQEIVPIDIQEDVAITFDSFVDTVFCQGTQPVDLPTVSDEGVTGAWTSPILTHIVGTTTYTFVGDNVCRSEGTKDITINQTLIPTFTQIPPVCEGGAPVVLPTVSEDIPPILGNWSSPEVDINTPGEHEYDFIPTTECAQATSMTVRVDPDIVPTFVPVGPYCMGQTPDELYSQSSNGLVGEWIPPTISTVSSGVVSHVFTVNSACARQMTMPVEVLPVPAAPSAGVHVADIYGIEWNWNSVNHTTGYYYNTVNDLATAIDNGNNLSFNQEGLVCTQNYDLFVWAYNQCEVSPVATLNEQTIDYAAYQIGDIGPAGGIIFYDKGNCDDGWRFLEVAPDDVVGTKAWGCVGVDVCGTSSVVGSGITNSQILLQSCTEVDFAAEACDNYELNGYTDWYLPSRNELREVMCRVGSAGDEENWDDTCGEESYHPGVDNIANISNSVYWSSSQSSVNNADVFNMGTFVLINWHKSFTLNSVRAVRRF